MAFGGTLQFRPDIPERIEPFPDQFQGAPESCLFPLQSGTFDVVDGQVAVLVLVEQADSGQAQPGAERQALEAYFTRGRV